MGMTSAEEAWKRGEAFTAESVAKAVKEDGRQLVVVDGRVLDVSGFLEQHPGGGELISDHMGQDCSEEFGDGHDHSAHAWRLMDELQVGHIENFTQAQSRFGSSSTGERVKLDDYMDLKKGMFWQILTHKKPELYHDWLEMATTTGDMRLLDTPILEDYFSRWPWWYIFFMWVPVIVGGLYLGWSNCGSVVHTLAAFLFGFASWTFLEYTLHRWLFHMDSKSAIGNMIHFLSHGIHHITPFDSTRLTFPPAYAGALALAVYRSGQLFVDMDSGSAYQAWFAGLVLGYLMYDTFHYMQHHGDTFDKIPYLARQKRRHVRHHYHNPHVNFGVTSSFWDFVFGTVDMEDLEPSKPLPKTF